VAPRVIKMQSPDLSWQRIVHVAAVMLNGG